MSKSFIYIFILFFAYQCASPPAPSVKDNEVDPNSDKKDYCLCFETLLIRLCFYAPLANLLLIL